MELRFCPCAMSEIGLGHPNHAVQLLIRPTLPMIKVKRIQDAQPRQKTMSLNSMIWMNPEDDGVEVLSLCNV
jgi:hypothetical protein